MIQRIQSVFYLLASIAFVALFYLPFANSDAPAAVMMSDQQYSVEDHLLLGGLTLFGAALSLVALFLFKNRPLQLRMGYAIIVLAILIVIAALLIFMNEASQYPDRIKITEGLGLGLPVFVVVFALLANRFVRKDENLVRSMDRLR